MNTPTHEEVAIRAYHNWQHRGSPAERDTDIWLEAERQLTEKSSAAKSDATAHETLASVSAKGAATWAERVKSETAAESVVEYHISPAVSDEEALKAALQKKEARTPQVAHHTGPRGKPPESGKPLWNKPHSS